MRNTRTIDEVDCPIKNETAESAPATVPSAPAETTLEAFVVNQYRALERKLKEAEAEATYYKSVLERIGDDRRLVAKSVKVGWNKYSVTYVIEPGNAYEKYEGDEELWEAYARLFDLYDRIAEVKAAHEKEVAEEAAAEAAAQTAPAEVDETATAEATTEETNADD